MNNHIRHIIIQLLLIAFIGAGLARAGGAICFSGCSHCQAPAKVSCCDDMVSDSSYAQSTGADHQPMQSGCGHSEICLDISGQLDVAVSSFSSEIDSGIVPSRSLFFAHYLFSFQAPLTIPHPSPSPKLAAIYTVNCSFLI